MAYDEDLAERVRSAMDPPAEVREQMMFGGLCFLVQGNMACGIVGEELMVQVGADAWAEALAAPVAREMDFTGRSMKGMVYVDSDGLAEDADLEGWVDRGSGMRFRSHRSSW